MYALSATTGKITWSAQLGTPVPSATTKISSRARSMTGVPATPTVGPMSPQGSRPDELKHGKPAHLLVGLNTGTGNRELAEDVDPPGEVTANILQRTGLTLDDGHVYFGYGGNVGDCAAYRGRFVSVLESGGKPRFFTVDAKRGESQGAIWTAVPHLRSGTGTCA